MGENDPRDGTEPEGVRVVSDYQMILANPDIQLVVVNTPNGLHFSMAQAALAAGKHVILEKPMTVTLDEARALMSQAREANRFLAVFHNRRLDADYLTLERHLKAGDSGELVELEWHYDRYRAHVTHKQWKEDDLPGAGTWFDLGVHLVDGMLNLFGAPLSVTADMDSLRRANGVTDYFDVRFRYPTLLNLLGLVHTRYQRVDKSSSCSRTAFAVLALGCVDSLDHFRFQNLLKDGSDDITQSARVLREKPFHGSNRGISLASGQGGVPVGVR